MIRTLDGVGWDELAEAFTAAFSDYAVPMTMTPAALAAMQARRGYVASDSFGAWEAGRLAGFVLTCRDGERTYNSGTGVAPAHRRTKIARALLDRVIARVAGPYVLEVLETNDKAIAFYASVGFIETRRLQCWAYGGDRAALDTATRIEAIAVHADVALAWQNSVASIRRAPVPPVVLGDARGGVVVFPDTGDVPLLAVARDARRQGCGRRLLAAAAHAANRPLRLLNVDDRDAGIAAFLVACGATRTVRQLEMSRG